MRQIPLRCHSKNDNDMKMEPLPKGPTILIKLTQKLGPFIKKHICVKYITNGTQHVLKDLFNLVFGLNLFQAVFVGRVCTFLH